MSGPLIELVDLGRVFDGGGAPVRALDGISLRVHAGEFVCLTGPSGSGKSTLLNIIGCLDRPTAGGYRVLDSDAVTLDDDGLATLRRKAFGFVFQSYNLLESLTAQDNVELPLKYAGQPRRECERGAREAMTAMGVGHRSRHRPAELSGGERQRVAIARALVNGAPIILADEPTGALDQAQAAKLLDVLAAWVDGGRAVVVASHDKTVASRAHRVVELNDGVVVKDSGSALPAPARQTSVQERRIGHRGGMPWLTSVRSGFAALGAGRLRTVLTISCVALGTWSVLALLGLVEGVGRDMAAAMERMGTNRLSVSKDLPVGVPFERMPLTIADAEAIHDAVDNIDTVLPGMWGRLPVGRGGKSIEQVVVRGKSDLVPRTMQNVHWPLAAGTYLTRGDGEQAAQVAVIGPTVYKQLYAPGEPAAGTHIHIGGLPFLVKGVLTDHPTREGEGEMLWTGPDGLAWFGMVVHIPFRTGADVLWARARLDGLDVLVADAARIEETAADIRDALYRRLGIHFTAQNDALLWTSGKELSQLHVAVLASMAAAAILVGGLGVVAVTLAAVGQRTREIGIRMAVGARRRDITAQFLVETAVATSIGGAIGVSLGLAGSPLLAHLTGAPVAFAPWFVAVALACAIGTGLAFGIVPARRAARLDPVAALAGN